MREQKVYLDSSALIKRYVKEDGTELIDRLFDHADTGKIRIYSSLWNIGEAIGVFDRYSRRKVLVLNEVLSKFFNELERLNSKGAFETIDITPMLVSDSIDYVVGYHMYMADALQLASCKYMECDRFFTADRHLNRAARTEKIKSILIGVTD